MFNKKAKLIAAISAASLASSVVVAEPAFDWAAAVYSIEGAASEATFTAPTVTVTWGAEYARDDLIDISFNTALDNAYTPASVLTAYADCAGMAAGEIASAGDNGGVITLGLISNTTDSVTYRVTEIDYTAPVATDGGVCDTDGLADGATVVAASSSSTIGAVFDIAGLEFEGADANSAGSISGVYSATLSNGVTPLDGGVQTIIDDAGTVDVADDNAQLASFASQYNLDVSVATQTAGFDGIINVSATPTRSAFDPDAVDVATVDIDEATYLTPADSEEVTLIVTGDFSYVVDENSVTAGVQSNAFTMVDAAGAGAPISPVIVINGGGADTATFTGTASSFQNLVVTFDNDENGNTLDGVAVAGFAPTAVLVKGDFSAAVSVSYDDNGDTANSKTLTGDLAIGEWTLNGSTSTVQAYPVGSNISNFLWVTNTGANDGDVTVTAVSGGVETDECVVGTAAGMSLTSISPGVNKCLSDAGITSGRAQLSITVNAAAANVDVYAGYKSNSADDRLGLNVE